MSNTTEELAAAQADAAEEAQRLKADSDAVGTVGQEIFTSYEPTHPIAGAPVHPGDVAEAASLAATAAPECDYPLCHALLDGGKLSDLQLESIRLASERHRGVVPTTPPSRCGFFLGDGAGVGKGRQLAGLILDQTARGRLKHVWFSSSADLRTDAMRDLRDLECHMPVHDGCQGLDKGSKALGLVKVRALPRVWRASPPHVQADARTLIPHRSTRGCATRRAATPHKCVCRALKKSVSRPHKLGWQEMQTGVLFSTYSTLVSATSAQKQKSGSRLTQ